MTREMELFETMVLENGLEFRLYNGSRIIADKLWYVSLTGEVAIPVTEAAFKRSGREAPDMEAIMAGLGERIVFKKKMERNFIHEDKIELSLQSIRELFIDSIIKYLSREDFPAHYILKCYREYLKKEKLEAQRASFSGE